MASSDTELPNSWASGSLWGMAGYKQVVTFIGAGGKTTCLRLITQEISTAGHRVIATTTTKVFPEESMKAWKSPNPPPDEQEGACFWYVEVMEKNGKWIGPPLKAVDDAINSARAISDVGIHELPLQASASGRNVPDLHLDKSKRYWVIEGDGAKRLKLKCWQTHEPQIPRRSDCVMLVLDGDLWGSVLREELVHRPDVCSELLGQVWNAEQAWRYFLRSPIFDPQYGQMAWVILLNTKASRDSFKPLLELNQRWAEIQQEVKDLVYRPKHLRLAMGNVKEGKLQWFDLW